MKTIKANQEKTKKIYYEINFIRALACLCIVSIHVTAIYYYENDKSFSMLTQFFNQITRYGTPAFAIISGFLLYNQAINRKFSLKYFIKQRFSKVVIPFLIWSCLYLFIRFLYGQYYFPDIKSFEDLKNFLYLFFTGKSYYHLYFISLVVQFYLIFPLLQLINTKRNLILLTILSIFINYFFVKFTIDFGSGLFKTFINDRVFLFHWIYYFILGGVLVHYWEGLMKWVKNNINFSITLGVIVLIAGFIEYNIIDWLATNRLINMINLPILFVSIAGVYYKLSPFNRLRNFILIIGNYSMGIYLVHPLIIFLFRTHFSFLFKGFNYFLIVYMLVILLTIGLVKLIALPRFGNYIVTIVKLPKDT